MLCWSRVLLLLYVLLLAAATEDSGGAAMSHAEGPPLNVIVEAVSGTALNMSWDPPDEEPQYYEVTDVRDSFNELAYTTYCLIDELQPCTTYFYTVASHYESKQYPSPPTSGTTLASVPPPPLNCDFDNITTNSMYLTWSAPDTACHISNYNISWSWSSLWEDEHDSGKTLSTVTHTSLWDLPPYANVTVNIAAATDAGFGPPLTCWSVTQEDTPGPPELLNLHNDKTSLIVKWTEPEEKNGVIDEYRITWTDSKGTPTNTKIPEESCCSHTINNLTPCENYTVSVSAHTVVDWGEESPTDEAFISNFVPPPPLNCHFGHITTNSMYLTWSAPDTACHIRNYNISWSWSSLWEDEHDSGETLSTVTHTSLSDLPPYANVTVNIAAATDAGFGPPLTCWSVTQHDRGAPQDVTVTAVSESALRVSWDPPSEDPDYYSIAVGTAPGVPVYTTSYILEGLEPCTEYEISVASEYGNDEYMATPVMGKTLDSVPPPPLNCDFDRITTNSMYLTWSAPDTGCYIRNYNISWSWSSLWEDEHGSGETLSTGTHTSVWDLPAYAIVTVNIAAATDLGFGPPLTCWNVTQQDKPGPPVINIIEINGNVGIVFWTPPEEVNGVIIYYEILFEGERGESISKSVDGTHLSGTVSDLQNGNYDVTVRAETAAGWGEESFVWSIVV